MQPFAWTVGAAANVMSIAAVPTINFMEVSSSELTIGNSGRGLSFRAGATTETQESAQTVLAASESVEKAAANLRSEVEGFLTKVAV
jgi:hypothetical protein